MARAAILARVSGAWRLCRDPPQSKRATTMGRGAFAMVALIRVCVRNPRDFVLALHDPVLDYFRCSGRAAFEPRLHVLGRGFRYSVFRGWVQPTATITETDEEGVSQ